MIFSSAKAEDLETGKVVPRAYPSRSQTRNVTTNCSTYSLDEGINLSLDIERDFSPFNLSL